MLSHGLISAGSVVLPPICCLSSLFWLPHLGETPITSKGDAFAIRRPGNRPDTAKSLAGRLVATIVDEVALACGGIPDEYSSGEVS